jgi:hypothetical protein
LRRIASFPSYMSPDFSNDFLMLKMNEYGSFLVANLTEISRYGHSSSRSGRKTWQIFTFVWIITFNRCIRHFSCRVDFLVFLTVIIGFWEVFWNLAFGIFHAHIPDSRQPRLRVSSFWHKHGDPLQKIQVLTVLYSAKDCSRESCPKNLVTTGQSRAAKTCSRGYILER